MAVSSRTYELNIWNLNTQLALIGFSVHHLSRQPHIRAEFIKQRTEQIQVGWKRFAETDPAQFCGWEDFLAPTFAKKESDWLQTNLPAVIEFSEHRLNQMELIVRYALFEAVLTDVVGNILWEYPELTTNAVHNSFEAPKDRLREAEDAEDFRARRTAKLVECVDKLPYKPTPGSLSKKKKNSNSPACLSEYFKMGLALEFGQEQFADALEKVRLARNKIAHRSNVSPRILTDEFMGNARSALSEFPRQLIANASEGYPDACTTEALDGEIERPGYLIRKLLNGI